MKRRNFLKLIPLGGFGLIVSPLAGSMFLRNRSDNARRILLKVVRHKSVELPEGNRIPFGWSAIGIAPGDSVLLKPERSLPEGNLRFRVSVAQEIWDEKLLRVRIPNTGTDLGALNIRFSSVLVPYELEVAGVHVPQINQNGLEVRLEAPSPLWIFDQPGPDLGNTAFLTHILVSPDQKGAVDDFLNCFMSVHSVQAFGWREGCVLDGLWQIYSRKGEKKALETIRQHLRLFFDRERNLIYETSRSKPNDNRIDGIESTIPFATLARLDATHPALTRVTEAWKAYTKENGMITDGSMISAEGCYTVAYPMAVIGKKWDRDDLKRTALEQLKHRFVLIDKGQFYLRHTEGKRTYTNWARGAAWFLLGFARTMSELKNDIRDEAVIQKFQEAVKVALSFQNKNGLWNCFMHEPETAPDTSGSAGIAAAILTGIQDGFLPGSYREPALKCWDSLQSYLTPDGFLKGVAQDNRGGIGLQQSDYRVIAQMGMGMMAQLYAAL
ncbi:MAG: glycoside hydrolase family 88 protein [Prolixibacteraceae bacterium]